jgi:hypothetical protein
MASKQFWTNGKLVSIGLGWVRAAAAQLGLGDEGVEALAAQRLAVCLGCPQYAHGVCRACGCPLAAKVRSLDRCPQDKW